MSPKDTTIVISSSNKYQNGHVSPSETTTASPSPPSSKLPNGITVSLSQNQTSTSGESTTSPSFITSTTTNSNNSSPTIPLSSASPPTAAAVTSHHPCVIVHNTLALTNKINELFCDTTNNNKNTNNHNSVRDNHSTIYRSNGDSTTNCSEKLRHCLTRKTIEKSSGGASNAITSAHNSDDHNIVNDSCNSVIVVPKEENDRIQELLQRGDTAIIFPEAVSSNLSSIEQRRRSHMKHNDVPLLPPRENQNPAEPIIHMCPRCRLRFTSLTAFTEHLEVAHGSKFNENESSMLQRVPESGIAAGIFICPHCNISFNSRDDLDKHELLHSPQSQVSCKTCNKTFANVYRLQRHMISHDESVMLRKFKCSQCEKAFKFKHHLKEHIRIHSGEKPFECTNCGKRFSHSGSYSSHMTSKKCLIMNLKLGKNRNNYSNQHATSPTKSQPERIPTISAQSNSLINNNVMSNLNQNAFLPMVPKYHEAAALLSVLPTPYNLPINSLPSVAQLRQLYAEHPALLPYVLPQLPLKQDDHTDNVDNYSETGLKPHAISEPRNSTSSEENLVIDIDNRSDDQPPQSSPNKDKKNNFEIVNHSMEAMHASLTKQFLQSNTIHSELIEKLTQKTNMRLENDTDKNDHDESVGDQSEGLAAKLEETVKMDDTSIHSGSFSNNEDDMMDIDGHSYHNETDENFADDSRKVRVRSLFTDEQLDILKSYYNFNPRPNKRMLAVIGEQIGFSVRVVRVWFQNTRARDRREHRHKLGGPPGSNLLFSTNSPMTDLSLSPSTSPYLPPSEEPLDLSLKKDVPSPPNNYQRYPSLSSPSGSYEDSINLSQKSSSPGPYFRYQTSIAISSSQPFPTLPPSESRLAQILAQPSSHSPQTHHTNGLKIFDPNIEHPSHLNLGSAIWQLTEKTLSLERERKLKCSSNMSGEKGENIEGDQESQEQFICDQCDKAFSKQSSLARHKYEHSGQRPHKCDKCPKAFKHKHHLTEHKRLHSGEKPFQCRKCLKRFSHSGSYSQHMNHRYSYCKPYRE